MWTPPNALDINDRLTNPDTMNVYVFLRGQKLTTVLRYNKAEGWLERHKIDENGQMLVINGEWETERIIFDPDELEI